MQTLIRQLRKELSERYDEREARAIVEWLVTEVSGMSRNDILMQRNELLTDAHRNVLWDFVGQLAEGKPVQQVLGYETFMGNRFGVENVLIPRPETAELVQWIVDDWTQKTDAGKAGCSILDIGTGSGCIALTLAKVINHASVLAADLSEEALKTARENASVLGINNIRFCHADILTEVSTQESESYQQSQPDNLPTYQQWSGMVDKSDCHAAGMPLQGLPRVMYDVIVSNPPYIRRSEAAEMSPVVLEHEPEMALFVPDDDPLLFYRAIARYARKHLVKGGWLYVEINAALGQETRTLFENEGAEEVVLRQDINGRDRMIACRFRHQQVEDCQLFKS